MNLPDMSAAKAAKKAYDAERYRKKKDAILAQHKVWREGNKHHISAYRAAWNDRNRDKVRNTQRAYDERNAQRLRSAKALWRERNRDRYRAGLKRWAESNRESRRISWQNRRAKILGSNSKIPKTLPAELLRLQRGRCGVCRIRLNGLFHADHITPLSAGGAHVARNIQLLCAPCNLSKGAKDPIRFMQERGFML